ncbi:glycosyltransferase family 2 protein [bacterium]|nr:glycosyltransferase family 2 protein [bacterium]MBU3956114.1 glycosyltransferase family 2 protein [bacterium]
MSKISISIIAYNETVHLAELLENIKDFADEIIVIDCSYDGSMGEIAKKYTDKIFRRTNLANLNINKQVGIDKCSTDWILYLDPDERLTLAVKNEIRIVIEKTVYDAYLMPRLNYVLGRPLKFGGHYPDRQLRLFRRGKAGFPCKHVHERIKVSGKTGYMKEPFIHYTYSAVKDFIAKLDFYSDFNADYMYKQGVKPVIYSAMLKPMVKFVRKSVFQFGFLDGFAGLLALFFSFANVVVSYAKLWEKIRNKKREAGITVIGDKKS